MNCLFHMKHTTPELPHINDILIYAYIYNIHNEFSKIGRSFKN